MLDLAVTNSSLELRSPEDIAAAEVGSWHGHVHTTVCAASSGVLGWIMLAAVESRTCPFFSFERTIPIGHDISAVTKLVFQQLVHNAVTFTSPRSVDLVVAKECQWSSKPNLHSNAAYLHIKAAALL